MNHFEEKLQHLKKEMHSMFMLVSIQLEKAKKAMVEFDKDLAHEVVSTEKRVNAQELRIDRDCENLFALYQPVAIDLRYILAILKINNNLERSGDIAEGIAKFIIDSKKQIDDEIMKEVELIRMFEEAINMSHDIEEAFLSESADQARSIFQMDEKLDKINRAAHTKIAEYIIKHPENVEEALHALSIIRKLERIGDQAKNIAEEIIFFLEAKVLRHKGKTV